jgi:CelD/BcsL family acetyltransferase involved in cellulose biosynthesis
VALAHVDGAVAAAAVFLTTGSVVTYKYGASDADALGSRPNHLVFASTIDWAREQGFALLDFGRTDLGHEGLRAFKASWGAQERTLDYTYVGERPGPRAEGRALRALGAVIRRSPPVVGRVIGSLLYRHAS